MAQEYKLKGVSSLDLSPGSKQEVEVEGIENGKVLLVNTGGKTQALGFKCTHYGAPLAKGVLTSDGRITCPWHGGMSECSPHPFMLVLINHSLLQRKDRRY
jgi:nitrite reductase/ring-hydroxylating ferredoxin subunit